MDDIEDEARGAIETIARPEDDRHSEVEGISPLLYLPPSRLHQKLEILQTTYAPPKRQNSEQLYRGALLAEALWAQQSGAPQPIEDPRWDFTPTPPSRGSRSPENVFSASPHSLSPPQTSSFPPSQIPAVNETNLKHQTKTNTRAKTRTSTGTSARIQTRLNNPLRQEMKKTGGPLCRISKQRTFDRRRRLITPAKSTHAMITRSMGPA